MYTSWPFGERTWRYWSFDSTSQGATSIYNYT